MRKIFSIIFTILSITSLMVFSNEVNGQIDAEKWNEYVTQYMKKIETINASDHKPAPRHQINSGIFHKDVICNNNLVLVLQWSSNKVVCVKQETAEKLIERQWGTTRSLTDLAGTELRTCLSGWTIIYDDINHHSDSKIIKTVRFALQEFSPEPWVVVDVSTPSAWNKHVYASFYKCIGENIDKKISEELGNIEHVVKAEFDLTLLV